jgi:phenylacetate-CoA ligase
MGKITGRTDDMLIIRGTNVFPTQIEEQVLRDRRLSGNYQVVVTRDKHLDNLEVRCEVQRELSGHLRKADIQAIAKELRHRIKTHVGVSTLVSVMEFDTIPRTQVGKARRVLDKRQKQK